MIKNILNYFHPKIKAGFIGGLLGVAIGYSFQAAGHPLDQDTQKYLTNSLIAAFAWAWPSTK